MKFIGAFLCMVVFYAGSLYPSPVALIIGGCCTALMGWLFAHAVKGSVISIAESANAEPLSLVQIEHQLEDGIDHALPVYVLGMTPGASPVYRAYVATVSGQRSLVLEVN